METAFHPNTAFNIGKAAAERSFDHGEKIMTHEKRRRELVNDGEIIECRARLQILAEERCCLRALLRHHADGDLNSAARRQYCICAAAILILAGLSFSHLALEPFGLGWQAWPVAVALAIMCAILGDYLFEHFGSLRFVGTVVAVGFCAGLAGVVSLAHLRADVLTLYLKAAVSTGSIGGIQAADATHFYESSVPRLRALFSLYAVATEIAASLLVWEIRRTPSVPTSTMANAKERLTIIEPEMAHLASEIVFLQNEPAIFEAEFLRDFYRGLGDTSARRGVRPFGRLAAAAVIGAALARIAHGQPTVVVIPDFTRSTVMAQSAVGKNEYERNIDATASVLCRLPVGTRFHVVGITEKSFSNPLVLLSGQIPTNAGPLTLLNRIDIARSGLAAEFKASAKTIRVNARKSDVIGAVFIASEMLRDAQEKRVLVIFSDMRQSAPPLDIERPMVVSTPASLRLVESRHLIADLRGVDVWILGVDAAGKSVEYIRTLRQFWIEYFRKAGATLRSFSMLRDMPDLNTIR
jgi:hypothetical protein